MGFIFPITKAGGSNLVIMMNSTKPPLFFWLAIFLAVAGGALYLWSPALLTREPLPPADSPPLFQEELIPYDLLSDVQEEYSINIKSQLSEDEIYQPAMALCVMVEKYADEMNCHFQQSGQHQGQLELISEALLIDQVSQSGIYGTVLKNQKQIVTPLYALAFQCVVRKSSGIRRLSELSNKKVAVGALNSEEELLTRRLLQAHGIDYSFFEPVYIGLTAAVKAMEAGLIDCIATHAALPSQPIAQMAANFDIVLLPLENVQLIDGIESFLPGYKMITVPSQTYKGMDRYILTAATKVILAAERETKLVITYELTKALYDHMAEYKSVFFIDQEIKGNQLNDKYPLSFHQGAVKYYWERDLIWN